MKTHVVVDLDGTLCNSAHRDHLAQAGQWDEFHSRLMEDKPHYDVLQVITVLADRYKIIALTGRSANFYLKTVEWLNEHMAPIDHVMMRPALDFTPDHQLKPRMLDEYFTSREAALDCVLCIFDDRDKVVEAWRNAGFRCYQTQPGGY